VRRVAVLALVVAGVLVLVELLAVPLGAQALRGAVARCVAFEDLEVTGLGRPASPGLVVGRVRDVEVRTTGVDLGALRVAEATLRTDQVDLPWRRSSSPPRPATLEFRVGEADLEAAVRAALPIGLPVRVDLRDGIASLGASGLPASLEVAVEVEADGTVVLRPAAGVELLDRLGLARRFPPTDAFRASSIVIGDGELTAAGQVRFSGEGCTEPLSEAA
jgi:hypothetical protein